MNTDVFTGAASIRRASSWGRNASPKRPSLLKRVRFGQTPLPRAVESVNLMPPCRLPIPSARLEGQNYLRYPITPLSSDSSARSAMSIVSRPHKNILKLR